jgi:hypothetical protein
MLKTFMALSRKEKITKLLIISTAMLIADVALLYFETEPGIPATVVMQVTLLILAPLCSALLIMREAHSFVAHRNNRV